VSIAEPLAVGEMEGMYLPHPPDYREKYAYFGKQRRWVFAWLLIAAIGVLYGYVHVAEHAWAVSPLMWLLLMVMVPPVVVNFWLRTGHPRLTLAAHQATVDGYREHGETVDIFLPSCGEPLAVLDNTFKFVSKITWTGLKTVYVLDDSDREKVRGLAELYNFQYIVRPDPGQMKKAGNLTYALGISSGDFIVVIDADFAVRPEFLYETMPYFSDPKVGIVQTAQYFDVTDRSFSYIQRYAGTLQEIFFRFIQPARDRYKAAICAGTNLVYRRAAVVTAGGFAQVPIGEDVHSGVKLWWAGYETRYLPLCRQSGK
jgi:cellulose synthase (UDP-forming)